MTRQRYSTRVVADVNVPNVTETVVATLPGVSTSRPLSVFLRGWVQLTSGATTSAVTLRIRRGVDATGVLIGEANPVTIGAAAGTTEEYELTTEELGADLAGATYVLTVQQTAATAPGTAVQAELLADVPE